MLRINLLPPEILERRKYERFYPWVVLVGVLVLKGCRKRHSHGACVNVFIRN